MACDDIKGRQSRSVCISAATSTARSQTFILFSVYLRILVGSSGGLCECTANAKGRACSTHRRFPVSSIDASQIHEYLGSDCNHPSFCELDHLSFAGHDANFQLVLRDNSLILNLPPPLYPSESWDTKVLFSSVLQRRGHSVSHVREAPLFSVSY